MLGLSRTNCFPLQLLIGMCVLGLCPVLASEPDMSDLLDMSLDELMSIEVETAASLTDTSRRMSPSTMTTITQEEIQSSGARNLYDLLEIYIPNFTWIIQNGENRHMGLRGIVSDRDDKYLMLVNGKVMNIHTEMGVVAERDLPMMRDIKRIDIIRGPGSSLHGPGAVAMVISILTENAQSFEGVEVAYRGGYWEEYNAAEAKFGKQIDDHGFYVFAGGSLYPGSTANDSPLFNPSDSTYGGQSYGPGEPIRHPEGDGFSGTANNRPRLKIHGSYTHKDLEFWTRFTKGSEREFSGDFRGANYYDQWTNVLRNRHALNDVLNWSWMLSFDKTGFRTERNKSEGNPRKAFTEYEYFGKTWLAWKPVERHSLAGGAEFSYEEFGHHRDGEAVLGSSSGANMDRWDTRMLSFFGEWQWKLNSVWTLFFGGRGDKHTHTDWLWSPRATLVYTLSKKDTIKLMANRSMRTNLSYYMREAVLDTGQQSAPEELKAYEIRYDRMQTENLSFGGGIFYHNHDLMEWNWSDWRPDIIANLRSYGVEVEAVHKTQKTRLSASHAYTKLTSMDLYLDSSGNLPNNRHSSAPYGYGNDFAAWPNHLTKIALHRALNETWSTDGSLMINWPIPGGYSMAQYARDQNSDYYELDGDTPFSTTVYLNWALQFQPSELWTFRFDVHNILGFFDENLNRRNSLGSFAAQQIYRHHVPSISFGAIGHFK